jgi:hypothetical protein
MIGIPFCLVISRRVPVLSVIAEDANKIEPVLGVVLAPDVYDP